LTFTDTTAPALGDPFVKRSRLGIIYRILDISSHGPVKKTHVMYRANLNNAFLQRYLQLVVQKGLLVEHTTGARQTYQVTRKGEHFMQAFEALHVLLSRT
jgi:predicted transcriptional regulator